MATKAQLIAEIQAMYTIVGEPYVVSSSDEHIPAQVTSYSVLVYESGLSEVNKKPILRSKYISFIVHNEGLPQEAAYYVEAEPTNGVDSDITSNGSLDSIHKLYNSESIRGRVQAAVAIAAQDILNEAMPSTLLNSNAIAGQDRVEVENSNAFWVGKTILLYDTESNEELTILGITGNTLLFSSVLLNSYSTANVATVRFLNDAERQQWASNALLNPDAFTLCLTSLVSLNPTIQAAGGMATDTDIKTVVNSYINKVAISCYL